MGEVAVRQLSDGTCFKLSLSGKVYRKGYHNESRAYVRSLDIRHNTIEKDDGSKVEFDSPGGFQNISPNTMVERLEGAEMAELKVTKRGGKPAQEQAKPANPASKRGMILAKVLEDPSGEMSMASVCAALGVARPLLLTHMYEIWRDHGVGYAVDGDTLTVEVLEEVVWAAKQKKDNADDLI